MRRCQIAPSSCIRLDRLCCVDCTDKICQTRCLNAPERCGCWENVPDPSPGKCGRKQELDRNEVVRLYNEGLLQYQIALRLKCSTTTVSAILKEMGVVRRGSP